MICKVLKLAKDVELGFLGPPLEDGPLPAVFYFALSKEESLTQDPYNQPALYLSNYNLRVFSFDLPEHGPHLKAIHAIEKWAKLFHLGIDPITPFIDKVLLAIEELSRQKIILLENTGLMGLSRGGFIASHVAAHLTQVKTILSFAPLILLTSSKEFEELQDSALALELNLNTLKNSLCSKRLRFYIGNRDTRVGTRTCFDFITSLAETAYEQGMHSSPIEMIISPSIGQYGHGTSKKTFEHGAKWLLHQLELGQ